MEEIEKKETKAAPMLNASVAPENFDWDAFESGSDIYGKADKAEIEAAYDKTLERIDGGETKEGEVTAIN